MQMLYNFSDLAVENAPCEIESMWHFAGLKLDRLPAETTILKFYHFSERHGGAFQDSWVCDSNVLSKTGAICAT